MARFRDFKPATRGETPQFVQAEVAEANAKNSAKMQANALRSQNAIGTAGLYNAGMGEKTPIADAIFGSGGTEMTGAELAQGQANNALADQAVTEAGTSELLGTDLTAGVADAAATDAAAAGGEAAGQAAIDAALAETTGTATGAATGAGLGSSLLTATPYGLAIMAALKLLDVV